MKILSMTVCCMDVYPELGIDRVGGEALNVALACRRAGADDVSIIGAVGDDAHGARIREALKAAGIDEHRVYTLPGKTASNRIYVTKQGDRYFHDDSWDGGVYDAFRLSDDDWEFAKTRDAILMHAYDPNFRAAAAKLAGKVLLCADFMETSSDEAVLSALPAIDVAFLSGARERIKRLRSPGKVLVVTMGADGSVGCDGGRIIEQLAEPTPRVMDTTGCGDAFQAGFIVTFLKDRDLGASLAAGAHAAADRLWCNAIDAVGGQSR